jgi:hypothetical protein
MPVLTFESVAQNYIFAGAIVPILDKFMKASGYHGGEKERRLFHVDFLERVLAMASMMEVSSEQ